MVPSSVTSLFDAMSVQPLTTPNQQLNADADGDGLLGLGNNTRSLLRYSDSTSSQSAFLCFAVSII